jgi:hypothetical protein
MHCSGVGAVTSLQHQFKVVESTILQKIDTINHDYSHPVTRSDIQSLRDELSSHLSSIRTDLTAAMNGHSHTAINTTSSAEAPAIAHISPAPFGTWQWGGQFGRPLPSGKEFPAGSTVTLREIHNLWHFGVPVERIRPFKSIDAEHFSGEIKSVRKNKTRAKGVVDKIDTIIKSINPDYLSLSASQRDVVWNQAIAALEEEYAEKLKKRKRTTALAQMAYSSVYENYLKT